MTAEHTYVTKEGLAKLQEELAQLKEGRREIANRIQDAKELGDLSENAEYAEAKNAQAFNEGRIIDIENILKNASVIEDSQANGVVQLGCTIAVESQGRESRYTIVGSNEADPARGIISNESPLGQALLGRKVGDTVQVEVPRGKVTYTILDVN